ncbi:cytochrome c oxidase assembly protein [Cellulomonas aerilata]|uniref:Cytochrome c oxidase assembly protein n=1 Tax=Cellulomonas aerilata TaxID=515326 RepID=A0A512DBQ9_9CELL|nr:cytochrome c oxidase assembly protein [Cellulomonas aerilata]GEO33914.1 hypothetical protein CAE01nite_16390 [Cellulomonas aerilata]
MSHAHGAAAGPPGWLLAAALAAVAVVLYLRAARGVRTGTGRPWGARRTWAFLAGVAAAVVAVSPLVGDATGGARGHMVQHVVLGMAAPLALVLGAPVTLALTSLPVAARRRAVRALASAPVQVLAHPVTAGLLHVGGLYALYLTPLYALTLRSPAVHRAVLVHFLAAGCLFAWSLVGPERTSRRPGLRTRVGVLVVASAAHGYLAKVLYARAPLLPAGNGHGVGELQDAARWMYSAGDVAEVALAAALFAAWHRRRRRTSVRRVTAQAAGHPAAECSTGTTSA